MLARLNHNAMLRYSGLFTWGTVGLWLAIYLIDPVSLTLETLDGEAGFRIIPWASAYLAFGIVYWALTRSLGEGRPGFFDHAALILLTACAIGVSYFSGTALGSILLMVVAGLLPWLLGPRIGVVWLQRRVMFGESFRSSLRVSLALAPTLIFTLVLAAIMRERFQIPAVLFGALLLYAALTTLLPSLVFRTPFDVDPVEQEPAGEGESAPVAATETLPEAQPAPR